VTAEWHFYRHRKGPKIREPIQGEFFSTDVISTRAEALIREGIQNSLDARVDGENVKVRLYVSGEQGALTADQTARYFDDSWTHFTADRNGLREVPGPADPCAFLVFEDFETTGLQGNPQQWQPIDGKVNPFYSFFRTEGRSDKSDKARGRWGVGKFVFPRSSRIRTFFALTLRSDDHKRLLMGQTVLMSHRVGESYYTGEGDFGIKDEDEFLLPSDDTDLIERFCRDFQLARGQRSGLSIVIPWCHDEINVDSLLDAVVREFFFPIMAGDLEVTISSPTNEIHLGKETFISTIRSMNGQLESDLTGLLDLSQWALSQAAESLQLLSAPAPDRAPRWTPELFPGTFTADLRARLEAGDRIAVRVPLVIRENGKGKEPRNTFFDIFLEREGGNNSGNPMFIREGLKISDIRRARARGIRSLVIVKDSPLTTFLGDSENPAHTQWQKDGSNFRGKYLYGPTTLDFVIKSVSEVTRILSPSEGEEDPSLLIDLFSLPAAVEEQAVKTRMPLPQLTPGKIPAGASPPATRRPQFRIERAPGGFIITRGDGFSPPAVFDIQVAYDVRRGNPFRKYAPSDFDLDKEPIVIECEGVADMRKAKNRFQVLMKESDFRVKVTGFDERRDLKVEVKRKIA
jgi:hypothetical protein